MVLTFPRVNQIYWNVIINQHPPNLSTKISPVDLILKYYVTLLDQWLRWHPCWESFMQDRIQYQLHHSQNDELTFSMDIPGVILFDKRIKIISVPPWSSHPPSGYQRCGSIINQLWSWLSRESIRSTEMLLSTNLSTNIRQICQLKYLASTWFWDIMSHCLINDCVNIYVEGHLCNIGPNISSTAVRMTS